MKPPRLKEWKGDEQTPRGSVSVRTRRQAGEGLTSQGCGAAQRVTAGAEVRRGGVSGFGLPGDQSEHVRKKAGARNFHCPKSATQDFYILPLCGGFKCIYLFWGGIVFCSGLIILKI